MVTDKKAQQCNVKVKANMWPQFRSYFKEKKLLQPREAPQWPNSCSGGCANYVPGYVRWLHKERLNNDRWRKRPIEVGYPHLKMGQNKQQIIKDDSGFNVLGLIISFFHISVSRKFIQICILYIYNFDGFRAWTKKIIDYCLQLV